MPNNAMARWKKWTLITSGTLFLLLLVFAVYFRTAVTITPPRVEDRSALLLERTRVDTNFYRIGRNWLRKNPHGLWELSVEGEPFERGAIIGTLSKDLIYQQEHAFVHQIKRMIPSAVYLQLVKLFVAWFNKDLAANIDDEYKQEIYGVSLAASDEFDDIASKYQRILNYHGAHDIGHALQGMHIVGCTSFSAWGGKSANGNLIVGRNFDFYVGDEFAENKIVAFIRPAHGYKLMMVTWGGMMGVVSGMNEKGLTVTLNAAKSELPRGASTPISIVAREILQYARTIDEAYAIARKRHTFVSESIMIGSLADNRTSIIEKTPSETDLFSPAGESIVCTNHYQGARLKDSKLNVENVRESASFYRFERVAELMQQHETLSYLDAAAILRDRRGAAGADIGTGNEKAVNQLIAHHSIIFEPARHLVWVSSNPYQLGEYVAYDLEKIFSRSDVPRAGEEINDPALAIAADPFLGSDGYAKFVRYKEIRKTIQQQLAAKTPLANAEPVFKEFIDCNPKYFDAYALVGEYYRANNDPARAVRYYRQALSMEIPSVQEKSAIITNMKKCGGE